MDILKLGVSAYGYANTVNRVMREAALMANPFDVLGIAPGASDEEARRAYRQMARRWHPDRFPDGPERMWAEQKMAEINEAYHSILSGADGRTLTTPEGESNESAQLMDAKKLMDIGQLTAARQALMRVERRSPEWNYLFGAVLLRLGEYEKSVLYFGIAMRQRPANAQYRAAFLSAEAIRDSRRSPSLYKRLFAGARKAAVR